MAAECLVSWAREAFGVRGACSRFGNSPPSESASKLDALQTLRDFGCGGAALRPPRLCVASRKEL